MADRERLDSADIEIMFDLEDDDDLDPDFILSEDGRVISDIDDRDDVDVGLVEKDRDRLNTHKQLSRRMSVKFHEWHQNWSENHLSPQQYEFANEWMMGNLSDYKVNHTSILTDNPLDKPPYRVYNRFRVEYK
ncbi:Paired amphipathic helix protein Sin3a [Homalodisca vitripennis]|nr:Paired amphipathic helix protein Sin3a [Homalodisca vitripennis]